MISTFRLAIALAAVAVPAQAYAADTPAPAKETDCVTIRNIRSTDVRSDNVIDFHMTGGQIYRNTLPHRCPSLGFDRAFSYKTSQSQLCSVDTITVLQNAGGLRQGASCGLGRFVPITKEQAKEKVASAK